MNEHRCNESAAGFAAADALASIPAEEALRLVKCCLPQHLKSDLTRYRMKSDFQEPRRIELGRWLHSAQRSGFLESPANSKSPGLLHQLVAKDKGTRPLPKEMEHLYNTFANEAGEWRLNPSDSAAKHFIAAAAEGMCHHYLIGSGWSFGAYEPPTDKGDIDLQMVAPSGTTFNLQIKAPDVPGTVINHKVVEGEFDERITTALRKASDQLRPLHGINGIVLSPHRNSSFASSPEPIVPELIGSTMQRGDTVELPYEDRGGFFDPNNYGHVAVVIVLELLSFQCCSKYSCTVFQNPAMDLPSLISDFPFARVMTCAGDRLRWTPSPPSGRCSAVDGTVLKQQKT